MTEIIHALNQSNYNVAVLICVCTTVGLAIICTTIGTIYFFNTRRKRKIEDN
jgi:uncharacterized membrane protein YciS (DUF1049 family)